MKEYGSFIRAVVRFVLVAFLIATFPRQALAQVPSSTFGAPVVVGTSRQTNTAGTALDLGSNTNSMLLPVGTTGQEPSPAVAGMIRYNSSSNLVEFYNGSAWISLVASATTPAFGPGFQPGLYYSLPTVTGLGTYALVVNRLYAMPFYNPNTASTTFSKASIYISNNIAASACELGLYTNNGGVPHFLISDIGNVSAVSTGSQELTGLSLAVPSGWSWLVVGCSATNVGLEATGSSVAGGVLGMASQTFTPETQVYGAWTYGVGALPATFPAVTYGGAAMPLVYLRL